MVLELIPELEINAESCHNLVRHIRSGIIFKVNVFEVIKNE